MSTRKRSPYLNVGEPALSDERLIRRRHAHWQTDCAEMCKSLGEDHPMNYEVLVEAITVLACAENESPDSDSEALLAQYQTADSTTPLDQLARTIVGQYLDDRRRRTAGTDSAYEGLPEL